MKKVVILVFILSSTALFAQREKRQNTHKDAGEFFASLSEEELATLKSKQLVLSLNLKDAQYDDVYNLTLNKIKNERAKRGQQKSKDKKDVTSEERYEKSIERLDAQIAFSKQMQTILNQDQFEKWQRIKKRHSFMKKSKHRRSR